ncbi:MAG: hypothetical protein WC233_07415 [Sphaerochaeta sp.]|jgi:hypothetical protein
MRRGERRTIRRYEDWDVDNLTDEDEVETEEDESTGEGEFDETE